MVVLFVFHIRERKCHLRLFNEFLNAFLLPIHAYRACSVHKRDRDCVCVCTHPMAVCACDFSFLRFEYTHTQQFSQHSTTSNSRRFRFDFWIFECWICNLCAIFSHAVQLHLDWEQIIWKKFQSELLNSEPAKVKSLLSFFFCLVAHVILRKHFSIIEKYYKIFKKKYSWFMIMTITNLLCSACAGWFAFYIFVCNRVKRQCTVLGRWIQSRIFGSMQISEKLSAIQANSPDENSQWSR